MVMSSALRRPGWGDADEDSCPSIGRCGSVRSPAVRAAPATARKMSSATRESCVLGTGPSRVSAAPPFFLSSRHSSRLALYPRMPPLPCPTMLPLLEGNRRLVPDRVLDIQLPRAMPTFGPDHAQELTTTFLCGTCAHTCHIGPQYIPPRARLPCFALTRLDRLMYCHLSPSHAARLNGPVTVGVRTQ